MTEGVLTALTGAAHTARWPRVAVVAATWEELGDLLAAGTVDLVSLWAEESVVHAALREGTATAILSVNATQGRFPSLGRHHPPALRLERAIQDLTGLVADGIPDGRPWLDHGRWAGGTGTSYEFLPVEGEGLHQIPVGPVHAGIIEPGHFRFTAHGETVVRLEQRLGYTHKGTAGLMRGADVSHAARLAGRVSGDATVAYAFAFALAAEQCAGIAAPARAQWLRILMAELERLANHLGDIGAICNDAAFAILLAHFGALRERVLRASSAAFGHRLMMDAIIPGGVARDIAPDGVAAIEALLATLHHQLPRLVRTYDETNSLQDRTVSTGIVRAAWARQFAAGGFIGRAAGRDFDARRCGAYGGYDELAFDVPVLEAGDVNARVWVRIRELEQSMTLIAQVLQRLRAAPWQPPIPLPAREGEGVALVESFRGDVFLWLRLSPDGRVAACHFRDPSWFQWPLLEAAIENNIVADFPLCNKSFNCAYSGHDG